MWMLVLKAVIAGVVVATVSQIAGRFPRVGGLVLSLPLVSMLAFIFTWASNREDVQTIAQLSRETVVLVLIGMPFFLPLALADRLQLNFWVAFVAGLILASICIALWFRFGPALR